MKPSEKIKYIGVIIMKQEMLEKLTRKNTSRHFVAEYEFRNQSPNYDQIGLTVKIKELN